MKKLGSFLGKPSKFEDLVRKQSTKLCNSHIQENVNEKNRIGKRKLINLKGELHIEFFIINNQGENVLQRFICLEL